MKDKLRNLKLEYQLLLADSLICKEVGNINPSNETFHSLGSLLFEIKILERKTLRETNNTFDES